MSNTVERRNFLNRMWTGGIALIAAAGAWTSWDHLGCGVPFCDSSGQFECPCHGSVFSRGGDYLTGPAPRGMDRYPVDEEDGLLYINTGERIDGLAPGQLTVDEPARGPACAGETHG